VLEISASPYNEVVLPPSLDDLREFFCDVPHGEERSTAIQIGALSSTHACWPRSFSRTSGLLPGAVILF
jgi:hypothetical protein